MAAHPGGPGILGPEAVFHDTVPEPTHGPDASRLFKKIVSDGPEKSQPAAQPVGIVAAILEGFQGFNGVGQGHGHFGNGGGPEFTQVITVNGHKVPQRHLFANKLDVVALDPETVLRGNVLRSAAYNLL